MPKINSQRKVENIFRKRRVVTMSDLIEVIGSSSRMTVFRRLRKIDYLSSYTHAGRYYTLYDIARFDEDGIWFYDDIGFSQNGSLKNTVTHLVDSCNAGKFHSELERQLRVRVHNVLLDLVKSKQIDPGRQKKRTHLCSKYLPLCLRSTFTEYRHQKMGLSFMGQ